MRIGITSAVADAARRRDLPGEVTAVHGLAGCKGNIIGGDMFDALIPCRTIQSDPRFARGQIAHNDADDSNNDKTEDDPTNGRTDSAAAFSRIGVAAGVSANHRFANRINTSNRPLTKFMHHIKCMKFHQSFE
jgi:hypothetical protein